MAHVTSPGRAKTVFIRSYTRFRFGQHETVIQHFRSLPRA
jgi:hypothetical protein